MGKFYHILAQKAMIFGLLVFLLLPTLVAAKTSGDPEYLAQQSVFDQINAPNAWDLTTGSGAVVVAVIDTGIDTAHPDLQLNTWTNTREIPGNSVDDDRNGFVDDIHGWNFVENNNNVQTPVTTTNDNVEAVNHGSLVAGLIGAVGDNGTYGTGLSWRVSLMPLRAISNSGNGTTGSVIDAINYAIANGADIINMSFVGDLNDTALKQSFFRAYEKGILVVAAAGNDRAKGKGDLDQFPAFPACYDRGDTVNWILGVSSINAQNELSRFADYGSCVDLVAPGERIFSTTRFAPEFGFTSQFKGSFNGTSFSAPLVAGAAALIKSIRPEWKAPEIIKTLLNTADSVDAANPSFVGKLGYGRLNVGRAVQVAVSSAPVVIPLQPLATSTSDKPVVPTFVPLPSPSAVQKFYYSSGRQMFSLEIETGKKLFLGTTVDAPLDFTSRFDAVSGQTTLATLAKKGLGYEVALFNEQGVLLETFSVGTKLLSKNKNLRFEGVELLAMDDISQKVLLRVYDPLKKTTQLVVQKLGSSDTVSIVGGGVVVGLDVSEDGSLVMVAELKNKKLTLTQINLATLDRQSWSFVGVDEVRDLRLGHFFSALTYEAALVVRQKNQNYRLVVDVNSRSSRRETLGALKAGEVWRVLAQDFSGDNIDEVLFWKSTGGVFALTDAKGNRIKDLALPSLKAIIY